MEQASARYSTVAIVLHWLIAALLAFQTALGFRMAGEQGPGRFAVFQLHKSIGVTILLLVAVRLLWRMMRRPPPITARRWERGLAMVTHAAFYIILFALPVSGRIIVSTSRIVVPTLLFGTVPWPHVPVPLAMREGWNAAAGFVHVNLVWILIGLFLLHVAGALKHHLIDRDGELARMAPGVKAGSWGDLRLLAIGAAFALAVALGWRWLPVGRVAIAAEPPLPRVAQTPESTFAPITEAVPTSTPTPLPTPAPTASATRTAETASSWRITRSSTVRFRSSWSGEPIDGGFRAFDGTILFGRDDLAHSRVRIAVDMASVYSGDAQRDETLKSEDWFSAGSFGTATFTATRFRAGGGDRYIADGTLAIKGVSLPSTVRFTLKIASDKATMRGTAIVDRTAYKIGVGDYGSTSEIPARVEIAIAINATRDP